MRKIYFLPCFIIILVLGIKSEGLAQTYFRSAQTGLWDVPGTWEASSDGLTNWALSASAPNSDANTITIRGGDTVTISNSITIDQAVVASGGVLNLATGSSSLLTINDGPGNDIIVQDGGIFKHNITGNILPTFNGSAILEIQHGGILEAATNNGNASNYANIDSVAASKVIWADSAIFNWNNTGNPTWGGTYFPALPAIPIFKFTKSVSIGGTNPTVVNGLLEAIAEISLQRSSRKTFRNGITGTGRVAATALNGGQFIINGTTAILGGTGDLVLGSGLLIDQGTIVTMTSNKKITKYTNGTGTSTGLITNSGIIIAGDYVITGDSRVQIDGTVKTTNVNGLSGGPNTTFATGETVNAFGTSSSIEYNRNGDQIVTTPLTYKNLIISGSGIKTAATGADIFVSGALNIMSAATFALNGSNHLKLNGGGTLNINTNAIFDNGGESEVSGGSSPKINIYGTFVTRNAKGLSGSSGTSIPGATAQSPTIAVNIYSGSTIDYGKFGDQDVSSRDDYKNLTFSGSGVKIIPTCRPIGTVTIKDNAIADASNKTFGDTTATILTMTGGKFKVGGTGTKPDIKGTYNLSGGIIEFTNSGRTRQTIRSPLTYINIEVSGSNVFNSSGITTLTDNGSFTIKTGGIYENSGDRIDGIKGNQTFTMEAGSTFITGVKGGFSGSDSAALYNIENLVIDPKSTIIFNRMGNQTITPLAYPTLLLKGSGTKTVATGTVAISPAADSVVIDTTVVFKVSSGAKADFNNRPVIIHSDSTGTGIIGEIADGSSALLNATNVTVERFIPKRRAFRFISPSVTTTTSIKDNWMEGAVNPDINTIKDPHPGFGTNITGRNPAANGFDATITTNPSLFKYNTAVQRWDSVPNTSGSLSAGEAYSILVRGDRSTDMRTNNPDTTNTILRATGTLYAGTYSPVLSNSAGKYTFIGNPYASPVDFKKMWQNSTNVNPSYYVWDPRLNTRGAYVSWNVVSNAKSNLASDVSKDIQPGQAVFVQTKDSSFASIDFKEEYKSIGNTKVFGRDPSLISILSIQLLLSANEAPGNCADGAVSFFSTNFSTSLSDEDSYKFTNSDENLAINHNDTSLSMEGRPQVTADDTIPLKIWQFRQKSYYLKLTANNFSLGLTAFVKDAYLHKETSVDLSSVTLFPFTVDTAVAASSAKDRFSVVFKYGSILPLTLTNVKAYQKDNVIQVDWIAEAETNIESYEVEKSVDGQTFHKVTGVTAKGNNAVTQIYGWLDENANTGNNFYRIKIIEKSGAVKYSGTINVKVSSLNSSITISPNPVKTDVIILRFSNIEKGRYTVNVYNNLGQKLYNDRIEHTALSAIYTLKPKRRIPKGVYRLAISKENKTFTKTLIFE